MSKDSDFDDMTLYTCMLEILEMSEAIHCKHSDVMNIANLGRRPEISDHQI